MAGERIQPILVNDPEARKLLGGVSASIMRHLRETSQLVAVKIGHQWMYDLEGLHAFVERKKWESA